MCYSRRCSISRRFNDRTQHKFHPVTENLLHTAGFTTAPPLNLCYLHIPACVQRALAGTDARAGYPRYPTDCISGERFYLPVGVLICLFKKAPSRSTTEGRFILPAALLLFLCYTGFEFKPFKRDSSHAGPVPIADNSQKHDAHDKA